MPVVDFTKDRRNKILIGGAAGVGLIVSSVTAVFTAFVRPALLVANPEEERLWEVSDHGAIGVGTGSDAFGNTDDCLKSGGGSGEMMIFGECGSGGGASQLADLTDVSNVSYTDGLVLRANGTDFEAAQLDMSDISGVATIGQGGTTFTSYSTGDLLTANTQASLTKLARGTAGQALIMGLSSLPMWSGAVLLTGNQTVGGVKTFTSFPVTPSTSPTDDYQVANKQYVDGVAAGLSVKESVLYASTANITLSGNQTLDSYTTAPSQRVLVKNQTAGEENGIYVTAAGAWSRSTDYDTAPSEIATGTFTSVLSGSTLSNTQWALVTQAPITVDTTPLVFSQLSAQQIYTASLGVQKVGLDFRADLATDMGLALTSNSLKVDYDDSSLGIVSTKLAVKALGITNAMLAGSIADSKLSTISTADKVDWAAVNKTGSELNDLADVGDTTPSNGQVLTWETDEWVPATPASGGGAGSTSTGITIYSLVSNAGANTAWTNMPAASTEFLGNTNGRVKIDLTTATQYRLVVNQVVVGTSTADLNLQYSTNNSTYQAADTGGAGEVSVGTPTGVNVGAWTPLVSGAKADVWLRLVGKQGNGSNDPAWRQIQIQFKTSAGSSGGGSTYTAGQGLTLTSDAFSVNSTLTGSILRFLTVSGAVLTAKTSLASSGSLTWEGAASGATLYLGGSLQGAGLTDCDSSIQTLNWDATTGRFGCGTDLMGPNTGSVLAMGDNRYVNTSGDTMTGKLIINHLTTSAQGSGALAIIQQTEFSTGAYIYASGTTLALDVYSTAGGNRHILFGYRGTFDTNLYRSATSTLKSEGSLLVTNAVSGSVLIGSQSLRSSGSLVWEGAASGSTLYIGGSLQGVGLSDCDTAGTSKLLWDAATGRFSCGTDTDTDTNTTYTAGQGLALNGTAFSLNTTITGALVEFTTVSGSTVYASNTLASSGALVWKGQGSGALLTLIGGEMTFNDNGIQYDNGTDEITLWAEGNETLLLLESAGDSYFQLFGNTTDFLVNSDDNNAFQVLTTTSSVKVGVGTITPTETLEVIGTMSGQVVYAKNALRSSGSLVWEGTGSGNSLTLAGGAVTISNVGLTVFNELGRDVDMRFEGDSDTGLFFLDASTDRIGIGTQTPDTKLDVVGTISGSNLFIGGSQSGQILFGQKGANAQYKWPEVCERYNIAGPQVQVAVSSGATLVTTMSGVYVGANLAASGYGSGVTVQVWNGTSRVFSTAISTDNKESNSTTAAAAAVINTSTNRYNKFSNMRIDVTSVGAYASTGVYLTLCSEKRNP